MKKIISIALALLMVAVMLPVMAMADGVTEVSTQEQLTAAVATGGNIKLANDIKLTDTLVVSTTVVLDMNGCKLYNDSDIWVDTETVDKWSLISVRESGKLTITGNGTLAAKANDCYAADVYDAGAVLTIENGTFIGNVHAIYIYDGTAYIKGGTYSIQQKSSVADKPYEFVLNCYDANRVAGTAKMYVTGGTFYQFNPANNAAEGMKTNFAGDSLVINNGEFCVGNDAMNVISNTSAGGTVRVVNGNNISGVPAGVIIHNGTGHDITVNGDNVPPQAEGDGDNNGYVVPNRPIVIITPTEDTPKADDQKNPSTGANDFVGVAAAMAVVSLLGAAAVIRKK